MRKTPQDDPVGDPWPEEEVTHVDPMPAGEVTPVTMPRCQDCGRVVFFDDFDAPSLTLSLVPGIFTADRCVRARDGHWRWCGAFSATHGRLVFMVPLEPR